MKSSLALVVAVALMPVHAALAQADRDRTGAMPTQRPPAERPMGDRDIYGYQLMTPAERDAFRSRMQAAKSAEERERIRAEHRTEMAQRAQERGLPAPDASAARGGSAPAARGGTASDPVIDRDHTRPMPTERSRR